MQSVDWLGLMAGGMTTVSFIPQVVKIWRTKSGGDVSYGMFFLLAVGVTLWIVYGYALDATPIVIANGATLMLVATVILLKFRYEKNLSNSGKK